MRPPGLRCGVIRRVTGSAEVRRLLEAAGRQYSTERTRPDGRVIEVRANPVPGGGVVIIYSDGLGIAGTT